MLAVLADVARPRPGAGLERRYFCCPGASLTGLEARPDDEQPESQEAGGAGGCRVEGGWTARRSANADADKGGGEAESSGCLS